MSDAGVSCGGKLAEEDIPFALWPNVDSPRSVDLRSILVFTWSSAEKLANVRFVLINNGTLQTLPMAIN